MKLIIAEKPELGKAIAAAIPGSNKTEDACIYKGDYAVIWAYGHLLTLKEPEDFDPEYKKWSLEALPIYFPDWGQKPGASASSGHGMSKSARIAQIGKLLKQCDCVIHAGDPDDEGQYLIDEILRWHKYTGPVYRMNTNDTTPAALSKALNNLSDNKPLEAIGWSAHARSVADMMVGCNCSRYFTLNNPGTLLTVGRVQTSTLGLVVARDLAIEGHQKQNYYEVTAKLGLNGAEVEAKYEPAKDDQNLDDSGKITSETYAQTKVDMLKYEMLKGVEVSYSDVSEQPPLPFNLTELQSHCSSKFGYDPTEVLNITQSLRDNHGAITYNRSNCRYLTEEQYKGAGATMTQVVKNIGYSPKELDMSLRSRCFNDSRITAHTAIIPQNKAVDPSKLTDKERNVYLEICKYFMIQFMPPAKKGRTKLKVELVDGGTLTATSTVIVEPGYLSLLKKNVNDDEDSSPLSGIKPGTYTAEVLDVRLEEKQTKPPSHYTKASLNKDMTRIARYVEDPKVKKILLDKDKDKEGENGSIGTDATRSVIIDKLVERGYCEMQGNKIISTPLGRELYRILPDELKKADMTAYWWAIQEDIRAGAAPWTKLTDSVLDMIRHVISTKYPAVDMKLIPASLRRGGGNQRESLGTCPRCGNVIVEGSKGFGCMGFKTGCKFTIWKESKHPMMQKTKITAAQVKKWLEAWEDDEDGKKITKNSVHFKKLYSQKKGKTFEGDLFLVDDKDSQYGPELKLGGFGEKPVLGTCPRCGGDVTEFSVGFGCANSGTAGDCKFVIWKKSKLPMLKATSITATDVKKLLSGGTIKKSSLLRKDGSKFAAELRMEDDPNSSYGPNLMIVGGKPLA